MMDNNMLIAGTIPVAAMAVLFDQSLGYMERRLQVKFGS
jgi:ABC-type proline/glycine betaine transport system permease subunit